MIVLGVDPGLRITGYGVIRTGRGLGHGELVEAGLFRLARRAEDTSPASVSQRLLELHTDFCALLDRVKPELVAVETAFVHPKHPATAMIMGHARGVLLLAVAERKIALREVPPAEVKKHLTGAGAATKAQMQRCVQRVFRLATPPSPPDVADALAIALCAGHQSPVVCSGKAIPFAPVKPRLVRVVPLLARR